MSSSAWQDAPATAARPPEPGPGGNRGAGLRRMAILLRRAWRADNAVFAAMQTVAAQMLVLALNMATGVITGRLLGPEGRGVFAAATLWPQLLVTACFVGVPAGIIYHIRSAREASGSVVAAAAILATVLSAAAVAIGAVAMPLTMRNYPPEAVQLAWLCVLATVPYILHLLLRQLLVALDLFAAFNVSAVLAPLIYLVALLAMWASTGVTVAGSALALVGSVAITAIWMCWRVRHCRPSGRELRLWLRRLASYAARGAVADLLAGVSGYMDRLVLIFMLSPHVLGLYAVAYSLSRVTLVLQTVVNSVFFPKMAGRPRDEVKRLHDHAFRFVLYAVLVGVAAAMALGREAIVILYGKSFADAGLLFGILIVEGGLSCVAQVSVQLFYAFGRPGYVSASQAVGFGVAVVGLACLVPPFGGPGAAAAMAVAAGVRLAVLLAGIPGTLGLCLPRLRPRRSDLTYLKNRLQS
jgi:O-antigen/teichoic acid export membrane protein